MPEKTIARLTQDADSLAAPPNSGERKSQVIHLIECARTAERDSAVERVHELTEQALQATGRGLDLNQADLSGLDLSDFDLRHAILNRAALYRTTLARADLTGASMVCAGLERTDFTEAILRGAYVHALAAQASKFVGADLTGLVDATGALFHGCDLSGARLDNSELAGTTFYQCNLAGAHARGTDFHGAVFNECRMEGADLSRARLDDAMVTRSSMRRVTLDQARGGGLVIQRPTAADGLRLVGAHLPRLRLVSVRCRDLNAVGLHAPHLDIQDCHLASADFSNADLSHSRWHGSAVDHAKFVGAVLTDASFCQVSAVGADLNDATGEGLTATECGFADATFIGFAGRYATFRNCDFRAANLRGAYLYRSSFIGDPPASACMVDTTLDGANLTQAYLAADFTGASLRQVWATYARINQSIFNDADLRGASLFRSSAVKTEFTDAQVGGQGGVLFADRCPGLVAALLAAPDPDSQRLAQLVEELTDLLNSDRGQST